MMHLYIEDSAKLQIYRPMLNSPHAPLPIQHITNDHLPNFYTYGEGVGSGGHILFGAITFEVPLYFWIKYDLGQKYYAPKVRPNQGLSS